MSLKDYVQKMESGQLKTKEEKKKVPLSAYAAKHSGDMPAKPERPTRKERNTWPTEE